MPGWLLDLGRIDTNMLFYRPGKGISLLLTKGMNKVGVALGFYFREAFFHDISPAITRWSNGLVFAMVKLVLTFIFAFVGISNSLTQSNAIDSMLRDLVTLPEDSTKARLLKDLAVAYTYQSDYTTASRYLDESYELSLSLGYVEGEISYHNNKGLIAYQQDRYPDAMEGFGLALGLAEKAGSRKRIADIWCNIAMVSSVQGELRRAIEQYQKALTYREASDKRGISVVYNNLGVVYYQMGDYPTALSYYLKSLKLDEELGDKSDLAYSNNNLGLFYQYQKNYGEAIRYLTVANSLCAEIGNMECVAGTFSNLGLLYRVQGHLQESLSHYEHALSIFDEIGNSAEAFAVKGNIGLIRRQLGDTLSAYQYLVSTVKGQRDLGIQGSLVSSLVNLGDLCIELNRYDEAQSYLHEAIVLSKRLGTREYTRNGLYSLYLLDSTRGDFPLALEHFKEYILYKDSLLNMDNLERIAVIQSQYEAEKKDLQIKYLEDERAIKDLQIAVQRQKLKSAESSNLVQSQQVELLKYEKQLGETLLARQRDSIDATLAYTAKQDAEMQLVNREMEVRNLKLKRQSLFNWYLLLGLGLLIIFAILVYNNYLVRQNLKLQALRNKIASDLHDDVGSTLTSISIFSEMAQRQSKEVIPALETIGESSRKMLDAMADIVWAINPENDQFEKVILRMRGFAYELLGAKNIDFEFKAGEDVSRLRLSMEVRRNLYLIFKEATNNMVKYAEATRASYIIKNQNGTLMMRVRDNGRGFDTSQSSDGNGLQNMRKRAEEIGGYLSIDSIPGEGTTVLLNVAI